jgi:hypothetical protein
MRQFSPEGLTVSASSQDRASTTAELRLTRSSRVADLVWPDRVLFDREDAGEIKNGASIALAISAGTHTLQLRSGHPVNRRLGLGSRIVTFDVADGETAEFVCHTRPFMKSLFGWIACLFGDRSRWIMLERHTEQRPAAG